MDLKLSEEQKMIQAAAKQFAMKEIEPTAAETDRTDEFPLEVARKMAKNELIAMRAPQKYGGPGLCYLDIVLVNEQIGYSSYTLGCLVEATNSSIDSMLLWGNDEVRQKFIPPLCSGAHFASWGFTEPETGSNPRLFQSKIVQDGDHYVVNGQKRFISFTATTGVFVTYAKDDTGGLTNFVFEKNCPGYSIGAIDKLGARGSESDDIYLDNIRIPKSYILGQKGKGFPQFLNIVGNAKTQLAAAAAGMGQAAIDESIKFARDRKVMKNQPLSDLMSTQWLLAEMETKVQATRWLAYWAASLRDQGSDIIREGSAAKLFASQTIVDVVRMGVQIHGAYGVTKAFKIERLYRDSKMMEIMMGVNEINRSIIACVMLAQ